MGREKKEDSLHYFLRSALFLLFSACPFYVFSLNTPPIFHWFHWEETPLSPQETQSIRSWQRLHPRWQFNLWTHSDCPLKNVTRRLIDPRFKDLETLRAYALQNEGGVAIHPDLIGCKTLDKLCSSATRFSSEDGQSIMGCAPGFFEAPKKILPTDFILPDQVFSRNTSPSRTTGVCFWRFKAFPSLTEEFRRIHTAKGELEASAALCMKKVSKIKRVGLAIFLLSFLNALLLSRFYRKWVWGIVPATSLPLLLSLFHFSPSLQKEEWRKSPLSFQELTQIERPLNERDRQQISAYGELFSKNLPPLYPSGSIKIPSIIHFIWGGAPFPETSIPNLLSWMKHHPDWTFKFWTDDPERPLPLEGMEKHLFKEILSSSIAEYVEDSKNWGEKSDLLRYEILRQEGGLYVDHDIECFQPFNHLHDHLTFYASLEPIHPSPILDSCVTVTNCLIGASPGHPILSAAIEESQRKWKLVSSTFPENDRLSTLLRTLSRTFSSFNTAIEKQVFSEKSGQSLILPPCSVFRDHFPTSFSQAIKKLGLPLANHQWKNSWISDAPEATHLKFPERLAQKISSLLKMFNTIFYSLLSLFGFLLIILSVKYIRVPDKLGEC